MTVSIRPAIGTDTALIAEFNRRLAEETENKTLDEATVVAGVQALLDTPGRGRYYVAESGAALIGQLLITYEWSDWRNGQFWWIQSVYVLAGHRRRGVFSMLYRHVAGLAERDPGVCGLRLYVDERNERALRVYRSLGLDHAGYRVMERVLD